jgi:hypothetical protein
MRCLDIIPRSWCRKGDPSTGQQSYLFEKTEEMEKAIIAGV